MPCLSLVEVRKRRRLLLVAILVSLLGVACIYLANDREPRYQGKELIIWLDLCSDPSHPGYAAEGLEADHARSTLAAIGTNAVPLLVKWIGYETPWWNERAVGILKRMPRWPLMSAWTNSLITDTRKSLHRRAIAPAAFVV